jgi:hypothetical protein
MYIWQKLPDNTCVLLDKSFTTRGELKDSPAHIIPSAIGGRLKPKGILSVQGNNLLAQCVDGPFVETFGHSLTYLTRLKRDRGQSDSTKLSSADGKIWQLSFEKPSVEPARPTISVKVGEEKSQSIQFSGTPEQFRAFLKSKGLERHADRLIADATKRSETSPELNLGIKPFKSAILSVAAWTSAALYAAYKLRIRLPGWINYVNGPLEEESLAPPVRYAPRAVLSQEDFGPIAHGIALWDVPTQQQLFAFLQTFGGMGMIVHVADNWSAPVRYSYFVDPTTGKQGEPAFVVQENAPTFSSLADPYVKADFSDTLQRIARQIQDSGIGTTRTIIS